MSSPSPASSSLDSTTRATPVIAGSLSGFILLAVCVVTALLLRKRRDRLRSERALRMAGYLRSDAQPQAAAAMALPPDPDKPAGPPSSRHRPHHLRPPPPNPSSTRLSPPSPSHPNSASSSRSRVNIPSTNRAEIPITGEENHNNRIRGGRTSNPEVILAHRDVDEDRSDGDRAGALIPSIVVSEGGSSSAPTVNCDRVNGRVLRPPSTDTRPSSRRANGLAIPPPATYPPTQRSSTLLHPNFDSSSAASSLTSLPCPSLSSPSSSPTLPSSSSFTTSSKHLSPTLNNERIVFATHDDSNIPTLTTTSLRESADEAVFIGRSLSRHDDDEPPPAYAKCV